MPALLHFTHHKAWCCRLQVSTCACSQSWVLVPVYLTVNLSQTTCSCLLFFLLYAEFFVLSFLHPPHVFLLRSFIPPSSLISFLSSLILSLSPPPLSSSPLSVGWRWCSSTGCYPSGCARLYPLLVDIRYCICPVVHPTFSILLFLCFCGDVSQRPEHIQAKVWF